VDNKDSNFSSKLPPVIADGQLRDYADHNINRESLAKLKYYAADNNPPNEKAINTQQNILNHKSG
jgi:hypothetical protein